MLLYNPPLFPRNDRAFPKIEVSNVGHRIPSTQYGSGAVAVLVSTGNTVTARSGAKNGGINTLLHFFSTSLIRSTLPGGSNQKSTTG